MSDPITPEYLDGLDALSEAATEGPWRFPVGGDVMSQGDECILSLPRGSEENLAFIAAARQAVPRLVKALREVRTDVERLRDILAIAEYSVAHFKGRAEAAEAEVEKLRKYIRSVTSKSEAKRVLTLLGDDR